MDFSNEPYVRLYTRNTTTWKRLNWQARAILPSLMRVVDRAGLLPLDGMAPAEAVALHVEMPLEVVIPGLESLLSRMNPADPASAVARLTDHGLLLPKFIEANEAIKSDKQRQRESRARRRDQAAAAAAPAESDQRTSGESRNVTFGHAVTPGVTLNLTRSRSEPAPAGAREAIIDRPESSPSPEPLPSAAIEIRTPYSIGAQWWLKHFSGRSGSTNLQAWRQPLEWIGSRPEAELELVAKHALASTYLASKDGKRNCNPKWISGRWTEYVAGTNDYEPRRPSTPAKVEPSRPKMPTEEDYARQREESERRRLELLRNGDHHMRRLLGQEDWPVEAAAP